MDPFSDQNKHAKSHNESNDRQPIAAKFKKRVHKHDRDDSQQDT